MEKKIEWSYDNEYPSCPYCGWNNVGEYAEAGVGSEYECESCKAKFVVTEVRQINIFTTKTIVVWSEDCKMRKAGGICSGDGKKCDTVKCERMSVGEIQ